MEECRFAKNVMDEYPQNSRNSYETVPGGSQPCLDAAQNQTVCSYRDTFTGDTKLNGSLSSQENNHVLQLIKDQNLNRATISYNNKASASGNTQNSETTPAFRTNKRHRVLYLKRSHHKKNKHISRAVKRKSDGKFAGIRVFPTRLEKGPIVRSRTSVQRNKNNSKKKRHKTVRRARRHNNGSHEILQTKTIQFNAAMHPTYYAPSFPAAMPPLNTPAGIYTYPQMSVGNPSIMQNMPAMFGNSVGNVMFPQSHYPILQPYTHGYNLPSAADSSTQLAQALPRRLKPTYFYKPMCNENPPAFGCGRWYRLQQQESAKMRGFLPLLKVMFCCCCNNKIE